MLYQDEGTYVLHLNSVELLKLFYHAKGVLVSTFCADSFANLPHLHYHETGNMSMATVDYNSFQLFATT